MKSIEQIFNPQNLSLDQFVKDGYCIIDDWLPQTIFSALRNFAEDARLHQKLRPAMIGRSQNQSQNSSIRSDSILWLEDAMLTTNTEVLPWLQFRTALADYLNRELYLGINHFEGHLAFYEKSQKYDRHIDQSSQGSSLHGERLVTLIHYLNPGWQKGDGGELCLELPGGEVLVEPVEGRTVVFLSKEIPHSVLAAHKPRWSLTGWYRRI